MLRHALLFLLLSILVIIFANFTHSVISSIHLLFIYIKNALTPLFNAIDAGVMIRKICVLMLIPITVAGIPALLYRAISGKPMPYLIESAWVLWLILVLSTILIR